MINAMPRFSDLWTGGDFTFSSSPMPPSITDASVALPTPPAKPATRAPDSRGGTVANGLVPPTVMPDSESGRTSFSELSSASSSRNHGATMEALWHDDLLDDDAWAALTDSSSSRGAPTSPATTTTVSITFDASSQSSSNEELRPDPYESTLPLVVLPPLVTLRRRRRALVWFRHDLRLHDNLALLGALAEASDMEILPVYIIHKPVKKKCGAVRFQFLLECIADLQRALQRKGSELLVLRGEAIDVMRTVLPAWGITDLFYEEFVMAYATKRDDQVKRIAQAVTVQVHTFSGRTLFDPKSILKKNGGRVCTDFAKFVKIVQELPQPPMPMPAPSSIPPMESSKNELHAALVSFCAHYTTPISCETLVGISKSAVEPFSVPALVEFGHVVPEIHSFLYGGESIALKLLNEYCANEERVGLFEKPRTSPACTDEQSTTTLSPYVAFGCLSLREFFYRIMFIQLKFPGRQGPPPVTLDGQLMWREFFYCFGVGVKSFDTQDDNPMCMQINWKLQDLPSTTDSSQWSEETKSAMDQLRAWREGRTGYPWIDAVQRQIEQDGWAHHVARHAVACFLTRGDLYISWLRGAYFFQEKLIDLDWPINIGNWLWVSSSCFFHDYHQIHSPSLYVQAWDPQGNFIRKWVPALKNMPARYIFEPWKAPLSVQRTAGCLIGKDYPFPIVDHQSAMKKCVQWLDGVHEKAHSSHDGVLTPCCDHEGKPQCPQMQKKTKASLDLQQQSVAVAATAPARKRPRNG
jgi:cryptochrome